MTDLKELICTGCGDKAEQTYITRDLGSFDLCDDCYSDVFLDYIDFDNTKPPPRYFLAKPMSSKSQLERHVFHSDDIDEFKEFCTEADIHDQCYKYGATLKEKWSDLDEWKKYNDDTYLYSETNNVYWDDEPANWENLLSQYNECDCDFASVWDEGVVIVFEDNEEFLSALKNNLHKKIDEYEDKMDKIEEKLNKIQEMLENM